MYQIINPVCCKNLEPPKNDRYIYSTEETFLQDFLVIVENISSLLGVVVILVSDPCTDSCTYIMTTITCLQRVKVILNPLAMEVICSCPTYYYKWRGHIFVKEETISSNSEAFASELLENVSSLLYGHWPTVVLPVVEGLFKNYTIWRGGCLVWFVSVLFF